MTVIKTDLKDVREPKPVPRAVYDLTISEAEVFDDKHLIRVSIGIDGHLDAPNINHTIWLDRETDEDWQRANNHLNTKRFLVAFSIPHDGEEFDTDDFAGATGSMEVGLSDPDKDAQGRIFNNLILPKLMDDEEQQEKKPKASSPPKRGGKPAPKRR